MQTLFHYFSSVVSKLQQFSQTLQKFRKRSICQLRATYKTLSVHSFILNSYICFAEERKEDHVEHEDEDEEQEDEHIDEDDVGEDEPRAEKDKDEEGDIDEVETAPAVASNHTDSSDIKGDISNIFPIVMLR